MTEQNEVKHAVGEVVPDLPNLISTDLIEEIGLICTDKGWRDDVTGDDQDPYEFPGYVALAHSELSEALEAFRIRDWSSTRPDGKPEGVGAELADTIIRVLDMCDIWGVDINYEIRRVLMHNWTRSQKHGGKVL